MEDLGTFIIIIAVIAAFAIIVIMLALKSLLLISQPNEVVVLSGRKRTLPSGDIVGYRMIRGGRAFRMPFIEKASRMSLETIPIDLSVGNAYSKGGILLAVEAIANIKIDSTEPAFGNAVERFLDMTEDDIHSIAKDTLEGNLRGVLASLTPEEVNEDRLKFAEVLIDEAVGDLGQLGLKLDVLKITNISDERGYLDSIGRKKTAEVIANAKKAEADKKAEAEEAEADSLRRAELAKAKAHQEIESAKVEAEQNVEIAKANKTAEAEAARAKAEELAKKAQAEAKQEIETAQVQSEQNVQIARSNKIAEAREAEAAAKARAEKANALAKQEIETAQIDSERNVKISKAQADTNVEIENNNLRVKKAELEKVAIQKEKEAEVAGEKAKVVFEQEVEQQRIELQKRRLMADVIEPAKAKREALELEAKGEAAKIVADGEAQVAILNMMIKSYLDADGHGDRIMMLKMLPQLVETMAGTIKDINIDKLTMVDGGNGSSSNGGGQLSKLVNQFPGALVSLSEMVENATGVDILNLFRKEEPKSPGVVQDAEFIAEDDGAE